VASSGISSQPVSDTGSLLEFRVLGPVGIGADDRTLVGGHARQRALLAVLVLELGRVVPPDKLIDRVWGEKPPASVRNALYTYVARLKAVIAATADGEVSLSRRQGGYLLQAAPSRVDLFRFRQLVADATAAGDDEQIARCLHSALALWRGPALTGVDSPWLGATRAALEMERHAVLLQLNDVRLRLGQHADLVAGLAWQATEAPADERLIGQLMIALYRSGSQADALRWFEQIRCHLAEELGTTPGPQLRELHQQILRFDPALAVAAVVTRRDAPVPRQLPAAPNDFTGRARELQELTRMLDQAGAGSPGTVVISAIGGPAGVGKTVLALHWAHQVAGRFGDGNLYANLRGFDPSGTRVAPAVTIHGFLEALAVPPERIPADPEAQAGLYRSLLSGKQMLIVLDNAGDEEQVRPLLPASPASLVLITSRRQLGGLAAADGARLLTLDVLTHAEAVQLLAARIGLARAAAEPGVIDRIADLCACLPLALAVAAASAAARPAIPLAALAEELANSAGRLDALDTGDPAASVRAVFSWSYEQLNKEEARMFRLLGIHPGPDISVPAAASLAGAAEPHARRLLRELARAHLITEHVPGRYAIHDLLRAYAAEQAHQTDSDSDRRRATDRMLDHYLQVVILAGRLLGAAADDVLTPFGPDAAPGQPADHEQAMAWFEAEHQVLLGAVTLAAGSGADAHAWQMPCAMAGWLQARGHWQECAEILRTALTAAIRMRDISGQALSGRLLANACIDLGHPDQALQHFTSSMILYQRLGNRLGEARIRNRLGTLASYQGRYADALEHSEQALRLFQAIGNKLGEAAVLNNVACYHTMLGDYQQARAFCRQSLTLSAQTGNQLAEANAWDSLGEAEHHLSNLAEAAACYQRALRLFRTCGSLSDEAGTLTRLGDTHHAAGDEAQAVAAWQQALAILDDLQHPDADDVRAKLKFLQVVD
jgi:DNA-binding SARP family transcriptional activator/tetratricopeptide (TPR) repeat protein